MKKIFILILSLLLAISLISCESEKGGDEPNNGNETKLNVNYTKEEENHIVTISQMPKSVSDLEAFDLTNEYEACAAIICTLANCEDNMSTALSMLDYVMGPETPSAFDENFLKNQFDQYPYVMRSYFDGATVENDYVVEGEYKLVITENIYSRDQNGYVILYLKSSGADSERGITLRQKESTKEWFVFSDTYKGITSGIRPPQSEQKWA